MSDKLTINKGIPLGSLLGPVLYLLHRANQVHYFCKQHCGIIKQPRKTRGDYWVDKSNFKNLAVNDCKILKWKSKLN